MKKDEKIDKFLEHLLLWVLLMILAVSFYTFGTFVVEIENTLNSIVHEDILQLNNGEKANGNF